MEMGWKKNSWIFGKRQLNPYNCEKQRQTDRGNLKQLCIILHHFEIATVRNRPKPKCTINDTDKKLSNKRYKTSYALDISKLSVLGKNKIPFWEAHIYTMPLNDGSFHQNFNSAAIFNPIQLNSTVLKMCCVEEKGILLCGWTKEDNK